MFFIQETILFLLLEKKFTERVLKMPETGLGSFVKILFRISVERIKHFLKLSL